MGGVVADTHAAVWSLVAPERLSSKAAAAFDASTAARTPIVISAITLVELVYLVEKGHLPQLVLDRLWAELALSCSDLVVWPVDPAVVAAVQRIPRAAVPDMPDRIIGATALHLGLPLVTRDRKLQSAGLVTIW